MSAPEEQRLAEIRKFWRHTEDVLWLLSQLDAQAARVKELEQDAERLDWISEEFAGEGPSVENPGWVDYYEIRHVGRRRQFSDEPWPRLPTLRESIDAARGASRDAQEGT